MQVSFAYLSNSCWSWVTSIPRQRFSHCVPLYERYTECYGSETAYFTPAFKSGWRTCRRNGSAFLIRNHRHVSILVSDQTSGICWFHWLERTCKVPTSCFVRSAACAFLPKHGKTCSRYRGCRRCQCRCQSYFWFPSTRVPSMLEGNHTSCTFRTAVFSVGNLIHQETSCFIGKQNCSW